MSDLPDGHHPHLVELLELVDAMEDAPHAEEERLGDRRDGAVYRLSPELRTALKVSLITGRPMLLRGPPGCGKSSLAPYVARNLGLDFYSYVVLESSEPSELLWHIDHVRRLNDAQLHKLKRDKDYLVPGVLWQAFDPARRRSPASDRGAVVLIDELDKAETSFANSLLVAIGSQEFDVPLTGQSIRAPDDQIILAIFTSNDEKALPPAFLRRCIGVDLGFPEAADLVEITERHWPSWLDDVDFGRAVSALAERLASSNGSAARPPISTAEFLDLVQVLHTLPLAQDSDEWSLIERLLLLRPTPRRGT